MSSDEATKAAWRELQVRAVYFSKATTGDTEAAKALSDAALAYAAARGGGAKPSGVVKGTGGRTLRSGKVIPFGRSKSTPIEEADAKDLRWVAGALRESIEDASKERWRTQNVELLSAIEAELETR
jgi:hypothetical protein